MKKKAFDLDYKIDYKAEERKLKSRIQRLIEPKPISIMSEIPLTE